MYNRDNFATDFILLLWFVWSAYTSLSSFEAGSHTMSLLFGTLCGISFGIAHAVSRHLIPLMVLMYLIAVSTIL